VHTTLVLGHARGVVLLAAEQAGLAIAEYAPATIKKTVVGAGGAPKRRSAAWSPGCCGSSTRPNPRMRRTAWPWRSRTSSGRDRAGLGRLAAKQADRVMIETPGGVGTRSSVPLGVMERLPPVGEAVSLATELVVREDGGRCTVFTTKPGAASSSGYRCERRGAEIAIALMSALGVERGARAVRDRNIALLASVSGIGKKTAERLALELADKLGEFEEVVTADAAPRGGAAEAALHALERLGYATAEADRALRQALAQTRW